jgi:small nuclear ribonucleoprotein (snRNP)-like protein
MIYIRDDTIAVSRIIYQNEDRKYIDTITTNKVNYIGNLRAYIRQIDNTELEDLINVKVTTRDGDVVRGTLLSIKQNYIIVVSDSLNNEYKSDVTNNVMTFTSERMQSVSIEGNDYRGIGFAIGALFGGSIGVAAGLNSGDDPQNQLFAFTAGEKAVIGGMALGFIGGVIGLLIGLSSSTSDETIEINSAADLELLKKYVVQ